MRFITSFLSVEDWQALWLTAKLAMWVTFLLLLPSCILAWWIAQSQSWWRRPLSALVAMPLVLPPSVLGFYFLILSGPHGLIGSIVHFFHLPALPFSFVGLIVVSLIYSLPFMVQPLQTSFELISKKSLEAAASLGASPLDIFFSIILPASRSALIAACVMTFAHTIGEFGVVLMIGGNLPGITRLASVQIYDHVQSLNETGAHHLSIVMLIFSFIIVFMAQIGRPQWR
jgi:molybdate transport system permease protein